MSKSATDGRTPPADVSPNSSPTDTAWWRPRLSIKLKLTIPLTLVFLTITAAASFIFPYQLQRQITEALEDKIENMGLVLGAALEDAVLRAKVAQLQKIVTEVSRTHDLRHLIILDEARNRLHGYPDDAAITPALLSRLDSGVEQNYEESDVLNRTVFLRDEGRTIGFLVLGLSLSERDAQIRKTRRTMIVGSVVFMTFCLLVLLVASHRIVSPIQTLKDISIRVSRGDRSPVMERSLRTGDEVERLADAYFTMLETLRTKEQSLAEAMDGLTDANDKLRKLDEMKSSFLNTVSHELRTPLTAIKANAEIMLMKPNLQEEKRKKFLSVINSESDRLGRLINDVLDLAKIEAGKVEWHLEPNRIEDVVEHCHVVVEPSAQKKNIRLERNTSSGLPEFLFDRDRIQQVIINLLNNAIKFTPEGGGIFVRTGRSASDGIGYALVEVRDSGIGIPKDKLEDVFSKFKQVGDTLTGKPEGTGLGLPICREIVLHHKGKVWVDSEPGQGSIFSFTLPLAMPSTTQPVVSVESVREITHTGATPATGGRERTVLIVEDDRSIRDFLRDELSEEGYRCLTAATGREALDLARKEKPDLITLDVFLPDINGMDVARTLKHDELTEKIPIVMVTIMEDRQRGLKAGADAFIVKPFSQAQLLHEVRRFIGHPAKKGRVLVADDSDDIRNALSETLTDAGFEVLAARDGEEALAVCLKEFPDLVLLDIVMPKMTGDQVLRELRNNEATAAIPVLVLTGFPYSEGRQAALQMGAIGYLTKGQSVQDVVGEIKKALG